MPSARDLVLAMRRMADRNLSPGRSGNASLRTESGLLITPSGLSPEQLLPEQMVAIDYQGRALANAAWQPSSEWALHAEIYRARPEVGAVIHCHSRHATALACCALDLPDFHYMTACLGGAVRCAPYALFGTGALAAHAVTALTDRQACLLANHGQVAVAATLEGALERAELLEELAAVYLACRQLGGPQLLTEAQMLAVSERMGEYGQPAGALHSPPAQPEHRR